MSSQLKKFALVTVAVFTLASLNGCGTKGEHWGSDTDSSSNNGGGPGPGPGPGPGGGHLDLSTGGTATVDPGFPVTAQTNLAIAPMLPTSGGAGANTSPTRMAFASGGSVAIPAVVQGFNSGVGQGRVVFMPPNPETPAGASNVVLAPSSGTASPKSLTDPFGLFIDDSGVYATEGALSATNGRIIRYSSIQASGDCSADQVAINLVKPLDLVKNGTTLYVAEFGAIAAGGGKVRAVDLTGTPTANQSIFIQDVPFCTSLALDKVHNQLYLVANGQASGSATGCVYRVNLATFVPGTALMTGGVPSTGVTAITLPPAQQYNYPFDLRIDKFGNVAFTEGLNVSGLDGLTAPATGTGGGLRVIKYGTNVAVPVVQSGNGSPGGMIALRGLSLANLDDTGNVVAAFFTEGSASALTTTLRQVTFRVSDAAVFRHLQLDSGRLAPLGTLFDKGDTAHSVLPNVKYCTGSFGGSNGQVYDVR